jgi:hypothetical protein
MPAIPARRQHPFKEDGNGMLSISFAIKTEAFAMIATKHAVACVSHEVVAALV